ncbi:MAG TPA: toll/interleukin-1 receptor domain-containing protein [Phototrophicaceae bacterium]|nr:toll/interleukin-1 receptor domain-containing protein [Phototrophicaceae bacterium]
MNSATKEYSIFLSYARQDQLWVSDFARALDTAGIHDYWVDSKALAAGQNWEELLQEALRQSEIFILILTPNSLENPNVFFELGAAFADNKQIIPVLVGDIDVKQVPLSLTSRQWLRTDSPTEAGKQVARIIQESTHSPKNE